MRFGRGTPVRVIVSRFVRPLRVQAGPNMRAVRGSTVNGAEVQIVIPEGGCTRGDFIKLLEEATGEHNAAWAAMHGTTVVAHAVDKYCEVVAL